jgi:DNA-binding NtrC family response regulator
LPAEHRNSDHSESRDRHFKADQGHVLLSTAIEHTEKEVIKEVLQKARTRSEAIEILGISRRTFYTKLKQYNLA